MIINDGFSLNNTGVSNTAQSINLPRHRWYLYKEGFSPSLVQHAIDNMDFDQSKDVIMDPFNGSGTVTLFASLSNYKSIGYEVNPFSEFISKAKQINFDRKTSQEYKAHSNKILQAIKKGKKSPLTQFSTFSELSGQAKWLFNSDVLNGFEGGVNYLNQIQNKSIRDILKLSLINSVMDNCNAKKDGKCLRYKQKWDSLNLNKYTLIESFKINNEVFLNDICSSEIVEKSRIFLGDSRKLIQQKGHKFKLCITSPPYLNSFDYTDVYRPELFLGGFISDAEQLYNLRFRTIRSHIRMKGTNPSYRSFGPIYERILQDINEKKSLLWHSKIPLMIEAYFEDMEIILKSLLQKAEQQAQLWLIVGNSAYANTVIPTDLILAEIGTKAGWYLKEIGVLRNLHKRGSKYSPDVESLRESVVIFQNSKF